MQEPQPVATRPWTVSARSLAAALRPSGARGRTEQRDRW